MTAPGPGNELILQDVTCTRGDRALVEDFHLRLASGGLAHIRGPNGSGKTSLLRLVCGLLPPARGDILWNRTQIEDLGDEYNRSLVYIGHLNAIQDQLRTRENLRFATNLAGISSGEAEIDAALSHLGLENSANLPCKYLSQGQRRRLSLARLILGAARPLWILDEPFAALDASGIEIVRAILESHLERGGIVVLTTHQEVPVGAMSYQQIELGG